MEFVEFIGFVEFVELKTWSGAEKRRVNSQIVEWEELKASFPLLLPLTSDTGSDARMLVVR